MSKRRDFGISRLLTLALRHDPGALGLSLDAQGYASVEEVLQGLVARGPALSRKDLERIVDNNDKQRFAFDETGARIRASQGHSIEVDLGYAAVQPPGFLYHGTATRHWAGIQKHGVLKGRRQHVHLSLSADGARLVGARHGKPVVLEVAAERMASDGYPFYLAENGVWLTGHIPPSYFRLMP